ncbi:unnamed protein product [Caenorhabditis angaria]|uniref:Serpentine Receptor, class H n=1 Tax=Caenorhabditis angaria TaxID=860376 RepID=A0A9P1N8I3_9PELO|nr:unnamed protein product [Caenorhabditis angaria]
MFWKHLNNIIATENFCIYTFHILTFFEIPINTFVAYCIVFKTPKHMLSVRPSMLILHVTSTILDLYLSLLTCPMFLLPYPAGYPMGLLRFLNVPVSIQVYLAISFIGVVSTSQVILFENRYNTLRSNTVDSLNRKIRRYSIAGLQYIWGITFIIPAFFNIPEKNQAVHAILEEFPDFPGAHKLFQNPYFFCLTLHPAIAILAIIATLFIVVPQLLFYLTASFRYLIKSRHSGSRRTYQLRMRFMLALCLHVCIPMIFLAGPACFVVFSLSTRYYNQGISNLTIIFFATHGGISSIVTLIVHKPYRDFTIETFFRWKFFRIVKEKLKTQTFARFTATFSSLKLTSTHAVDFSTFLKLTTQPSKLSTNRKCVLHTTPLFTTLTPMPSPPPNPLSSKVLRRPT